MSRVLAEYSYDTLSLYDLAFCTYRFYGRTNFHDNPSYLLGCNLLESVGNSSLGQIIGRKLYSDPVTRQYLYKMHPHFP